MALRSDYMLDVIIDTLIDTLKLMPFLFIAFLVLELIEHKLSDSSKNKIKKSGKFGPLVGAIFGAFPQCGFSAAATNLYAARVISVGTLIAIYLSTSDEMLPIMLTSNVPIGTILSIIGLKVLIGMIFGFIIDFIMRNRTTSNDIKDHCDCEHSILLSSIKHTLNIAFFIMIITFILNIGLFYLGEDNLANIFMKN